MKPSKMTVAYLAVLVLAVLFDIVFAVITTWVLVGKINGTMFVPEWFFPYCIAGAVVNGAFFLMTIGYFLSKKR